MSADYPIAQEHLVPRGWMFNSNAPKAIVVHKTGGDATPQAVLNTFLASGNDANPGKSVHYAIGQDGSIWQFVPESLGAGGNGVTDSTMDPFWAPYVAQYGNLNQCTLSVEHCDPSPRNDTPLTPAQKAASFALIGRLCAKYGIDASHIMPHNSICATDCPGNYPLDELRTYVKGDTWMSTGQQQQALRTWNATTARTTSGTSGIFVAGDTPPYTTGIAASWQKEYQAGHNWGPPLTHEYHDVTWDGKTIVTQQFARGRCEWSADHVPHWYGTPA